MADERMDDGIREMGLRCYGYGRWGAPYWFIGPEQGQAPEENDDLKPRVQAWLGLGGCDLTDCREFHVLIGEKRWHPERPKLQSTWRPLLLLLMTDLGKAPTAMLSAATKATTGGDSTAKPA